MRKRFFQKIGHGQNGFTLVELLISTFLILSISSVVMTIFVAGLRGTNRSSAEADVRQNGNLAITQMSRMIRNAKTFDGVSLDGTTNFIDSCYDGISNPTPTPQSFKGVRVTSFDGGTTTLKCPNVGGTMITSESATIAPLTDSTLVTVLPSSCYFTCQQESPTDPPVIGISFTVESLSGSGTIGQSVGQTFQTTVLPRNYLR